MVDPVYSYENTIPPPVVIEWVVADGEVPAFSGEACLKGPWLSLRPGLEKLEIDYTCLSLLAPRRVKFKYRLEGFDRGAKGKGEMCTCFLLGLRANEAERARAV